MAKLNAKVFACWIKLYWKDFLSDPEFIAMSDAERGVFFSLILYMSEAGGQLDYDLGYLAKICNSMKKRVEKVVAMKCRKRKKRSSDGYVIYNKRLNIELADAKKRVSDASKGGKAKAKKSAIAELQHNDSTCDIDIDIDIELDIEKNKTLSFPQSLNSLLILWAKRKNLRIDEISQQHTADLHDLLQSYGLEDVRKAFDPALRDSVKGTTPKRVFFTWAEQQAEREKAAKNKPPDNGKVYEAFKLERGIK